MGEEEFVAGAQVVAFFRLPGLFDKAVFRTLAVAHRQYLAGPATLRKGQAFGRAKSGQTLRGEDLDKCGLLKVPHSPGGQDEMIAGIDIAIVFKHRDVAAGWPKKAQGMVLGKGGARRFLEDLYLDAADILCQPQVENRA